MIVLDTHDPTEQIIVATARLHNCPLITSDAKLLF